LKNKSEYLALILARQGSKRLKNKNILKLNKKPLILWTLDNLKKIKLLFTNILVSSDSSTIQKISKKTNVLFLKRPNYLSHGKVTSEAAALHAINFYKKKYRFIKYVILFQVTSPFRKNSTIKKAINLSKKFPNKQIVSVNKKNLEPNGVIYITPVSLLKKFKCFSHRDFIPLIINSKTESLDIDYKTDFLKAKKYIKKI
jgi:CMP-N-acetylneuraminic acid synthetase